MLNSIVQDSLMKPGQKITGVRGNQAGLSTCWYPFSSPITQKNTHHPPRQITLLSAVVGTGTG